MFYKIHHIVSYCRNSLKKKFVPKLKNLNIFYEVRVFEKAVLSEFLFWFEKWVNVKKNLIEMMKILNALDA